MSDQSFFITLQTVELIISHAQSLKDKRSGLRGLKDRIRSKFNASVSEVGYQNKWQRAVLAICLVGCNKRQPESNIAKIRRLCIEASDLEAVTIDQQWL